MLSVWFPVAVGLAVSWAFGLVVFSRFYKANLLFDVKSAFRISDLFVLAIHTQLLLVFLNATIGFKDGVPLAVIGFCFLITWWLSSIRMLSRAGVTKSSHRWIFAGLMSPIGYVSSLALAISAITIPISIASGFEMIELVIFAVPTFSVSLAVVLFLRTANNWICDAAIKTRSESEGIIYVEDAPKKKLLLENKIGDARPMDSGDVDNGGVLFMPEESEN